MKRWWVRLELFEHSRHCGSHSTRLLIDCMSKFGYLRTGIDITGFYLGSNRFASGMADLGFVFDDRKRILRTFSNKFPPAAAFKESWSAGFKAL
nr:hypothetical protein [Tanacetum cinerariifolium]